MIDDASRFLKSEYRKDSTRRFTLVGHTDQRGSDTHNHHLSYNRALAVRLALEKKGVAQGWLKIYGMGTRRLKNNDNTEEAYAQNRRVELLLNFKAE